MLRQTTMIFLSPGTLQLSILSLCIRYTVSTVVLLGISRRRIVTAECKSGVGNFGLCREEAPETLAHQGLCNNT